MELENTYQQEDRSAAYLRAQRKVENLKGFYTHLIIYICVNLFVTYKKIEGNLENGETLYEAIFDFSTAALWLLWGIGIIIHALNVFLENGMLGRNWEDRKIKEYLDREEKHYWE